MDLASLYGMPGSSESVSSSSSFDFFGIIWGVVAGVVLSTVLLTLLLFVESFLGLAVDCQGVLSVPWYGEMVCQALLLAVGLLLTAYLSCLCVHSAHCLRSAT